jgi:hypothetical protein
MTDRVRVGVVGLGLWGQNHALAFADYHKSDLAAVCDLDAQRATQFATTYECKAVTDYRELAADPTIDAVSVATPDAHHYAVVMEMLKDVVIGQQVRVAQILCRLGIVADRNRVRRDLSLRKRDADPHPSRRQASARHHVSLSGPLSRRTSSERLQVSINPSRADTYTRYHLS